jgi:hypothetical protein
MSARLRLGRGRSTVRRAIAAMVIGIVVGGCSGQGAHPTSASRRGAHATTPGTAAVLSEWCVPISREAAIARVMRPAEIAATDTAKAKLVGTDYWAVDVEGSVMPELHAQGGHFAWAVFNVDAHTGDIRGVEAGPPGSTPSDWNSLPDIANNFYESCRRLHSR